MATTLANGTVLRSKFSLLFFLVLIAVGLAGNHFNYQIFLNIDFIFGSIFAMLALQFFGLRQGILAAAMIASYTYILWNHPYAIIIMTAEVAVVGWLMGRRKIGLVLADTLYWLLIGMPLVYLFYHIIMHVPFSNAYITMTKQAVNGIANALAARLIFTGYALYIRSSLMSYREIIYNMLTLFVLCPVLTMLAIESRTDFVETDQVIRTRLVQESSHMLDVLNSWADNRRKAIINLAEMAASRSSQQMQPYLELVKNSDANFLRIGLLDKEATITAYFPLLDELGKKNIGKNFADRPFIPALKKTLKPMLSEVVMGRIGTPKPMVTMLAPVVIRGEYGGYVTGILSLERVRELLDMSVHEKSARYTLLDKHGNVIMTNRTDQTVMTAFVRGKGTLSRLGEGISQWVPVVPPNITISERWRQSSYVAEATIGNLAEWTLVLEQPVAPFQKRFYDRYADSLTRLFLVLFGALALAELLSRSSIATLEKLSVATRDIPGRLASGGTEFAWPESGIKETNHLIANFREMAESLSGQFCEVRQINESLEQRVEERTRDLYNESVRFQNLLETATDGIHILDTQGKLILCSPSFAQMLGYTLEEIVGRNVADWDTHFSAQELISTIRDLMREPGTFETSYRRKDGSPLQVEISARGVVLDRGAFLYASARNITQRKRLEDELRRLATTDPLTGIANRRHFIEQVERELARSTRYGLPLAFLMLDIDYFKNVNDTFGHAAGDEVLKSMALALRETLRATDVIGRLGGEEFGVLLIQTDLEGAKLMAERLRSILQSALVETESGPIRYTVSIGLASSIGDDVSVEALMKRADIALYKAKETGRNRVCCFEAC